MTPKGWHRAEIVAALHMRGTSLTQLARDNNLADATLRAALSYPRTPSNSIIANFLGLSLHEAWPHWFDQHNRLRPTIRIRSGRRASSQKRNKELILTGRRA